jgi:DNA-binding transcriptional regulator LsrR (DeoR family)
MTLKKYRRQIPEEILFGICERFIEGVGASEIARWVQSLGYDCNREQVYYPWLKRGIERGFLRLCPPENLRVAQRLSTLHAAAEMDIRVVNVHGQHSIDKVALLAAELVSSLVLEIGRRKKIVHIGFGAGNTTRVVARSLANRLRTEPKPPGLVIHSLSSGFDAEDLTTAPNSFFSFFKDQDIDVQCVGLFAPPVVEWDEYESLKTKPGVAEAFAARGLMDIVVTSLGNYVSDPHSTLRKYMDYNLEKDVRSGEAKTTKRKTLNDRHCLGDVMWRPFSAEGPILDRTPWRAVTVLELEDLRQMAGQAGRHVVVVAGPCNRCGESKSVALRPLLSAPSLRVCNHMVIDIDSAREMLETETGNAAPGAK